MIIGLSGKARVGKGEVAKRLVERHGFVEMAFADSLKSACQIIFGLSERQLYGDMKELTDMFWNDTPRNILQKVGTECLRKGYRDDVWVKSLERVIRREPAVDYVVSDVRFPNEAQAIKDWGGKLVRIIRPDAPVIATSTHASETSMRDWHQWDYDIYNGGTLDELNQTVDGMLKVFKGE